MISVLPQPETGKDSVLPVDNAITVAAIFRFIEFRQGQKPVLVRGRRLGREVAKQLSSIVDEAIAIPVKCEPGIVRIGSSPT